MEGSKMIDGPPDGSIHNIYESFVQGLKLSNNGQCLGNRRGQSYHWTSYQEVLEGAQAIGMGFRELGLRSEDGPGFVGVYARNCVEWVEAQLGAVSQNLVIVPLYDTLGADAVTYIVRQASIRLVVFDTPDKARRILQAKEQMPSLETLVAIDEPGPEIRKEALAAGVRIVHFKEAQALGKGVPLNLHLPGLDDTSIICYTSGTTGQPKGVMLSHRNLLANMHGNLYIAQIFGVDYARPGKTTISYLPLAHLFEQMNQIMFFSFGGRVGFFSGDIKKLMEDAQVLKPHVMPVVPRLLNRLADAVRIRLENSGFIARQLFSLAYSGKLTELKQGIVRRDSIWDTLVFGRIQRQLGGCVEVMVTGSAPISPEVLETCRVLMGCVILEGYGQTECAAVATITQPGDAVGGHVGGPGPAAQITLLDVPELNYYSKDGKGEIAIRGPCVCKGYFKEPDKTSETIDSHGWLHTGDVGMWLPNGTLRIIDRKKHIFKLAQGEYVAPEKIESIYTRSTAVEQVFVDGSSLERYLVGIVVPQEGDLQHWWREEHGESAAIPSLEELCRDPDIRAYVHQVKKGISMMIGLEDMRRVGKEQGLNSMEQVGAVFLSPEPFTVENGLMTPTMKSRRPQLRERYADVMNELYLETNRGSK